LEWLLIHYARTNRRYAEWLWSCIVYSETDYVKTRSFWTLEIDRLLDRLINQSNDQTYLIAVRKTLWAYISVTKKLALLETPSPLARCSKLLLCPGRTGYDLHWKLNSNAPTFLVILRAPTVHKPSNRQHRITPPRRLSLEIIKLLGWVGDGHASGNIGQTFKLEFFGSPMPYESWPNPLRISRSSHLSSIVVRTYSAIGESSM